MGVSVMPGRIKRVPITETAKYRVIPEASLIAWYKFNEGAGNTVNDYSKQENIGTITGATWTTGKIDNCLEFDGLSGRVTILDNQKLRLTTGGTIMAWIYPDTLGEGNFGRIVDKSSDTSATGGYFVCLASNNRLAIQVGGGSLIYSGNNAITLGSWQHIAIVFSSTGKKAYVNGIETITSTEKTLPPNTALNVTIGNLTDGDIRTFDGKIDETRMYDRALTASQIEAIYNQTK